jgi:hypothetical protein
VKLSLYLISKKLWHEDVWGSGGTGSSFLTLALEGGEWSASRPCHSTPKERVPGIDWEGSWLGSRLGLDAVEKRQIFHYRESNSVLADRGLSPYRLNCPCNSYYRNESASSLPIDVTIASTLERHEILRFCVQLSVGKFIGCFFRRYSYTRVHRIKKKG